MNTLSRIVLLLVALTVGAHNVTAGQDPASGTAGTAMHQPDDAAEYLATANSAHVCHLSAHIPAVVAAATPAGDAAVSPPPPYRPFRLHTFEPLPSTPPPPA